MRKVDKVSEVIKDHGFCSSKECANFLQVTTQSLRNWHEKYPKRFRAAVLGASIIKKEGL